MHIILWSLPRWERNKGRAGPALLRRSESTALTFHPLGCATCSVLALLERNVEHARRRLSDRICSVSAEPASSRKSQAGPALPWWPRAVWRLNGLLSKSGLIIIRTIFRTDLHKTSTIFLSFPNNVYAFTSLRYTLGPFHSNELQLPILLPPA